MPTPDDPEQRRVSIAQTKARQHDEQQPSYHAGYASI